MKIAYLILCHTEPKHIARLVKKITIGGGYAFIHVDEKVDIDPFYKELKYVDKVNFVERFKVYWGGYSAINATISLMKAALSYDVFDRFVLIQGLEYPIRSNNEIESFFAKNKDKEFISAQNISIRKDARSIHKYRLYHFLDKPDKFIGKISRKINNKILRSGKIPNFRANTVTDADGRKMEIYQGCAQFALTRDAVQYIVDFNKRNEKFNKYFHTVFTVDEIYFHTIIFNSKFKNKATEISNLEFPRLRDFKNLTYFEYPEDTIQIRVLKDKEDYSKLKDTPYLYFRKASSESVDLLDYIDSCHLEETN